MNVNNIMNVYIAGLLRGEVLKKRPRWLKKGGGRHLEWWRELPPIPYLVFTGPENQERLAGSN
jgi:hypothetical protein